MSLITTPVLFRAFYADGTLATGFKVRARLTVQEIDGNRVVDALVIGEDEDADGEVTLQLWPNSRGVAGSQYTVIIVAADSTRLSAGKITVPEVAGPVLWTDILDQEPYPSVDAAQQALNGAQAALAQVSIYAGQVLGYRDELLPDVTIVAGQIDSVVLLASSITEVVVVSESIGNVNIVGDAIANINTVAINVESVASVAQNVGNVNIVAPNITNVNAVADSIANVNIAANNLSSIANFSLVYLGGFSANPTTRQNGSTLQSGDFGVDTVAGTVKFRINDVWVDPIKLSADSAMAASVSAQAASGSAVDALASANSFALQFAQMATAILNTQTIVVQHHAFA